MDPNELSRLEASLREMLEGSSLEWLLDEVDGAVAVGVPEEKLLQRRVRAGGEEWSAEEDQVLVQDLQVPLHGSRQARHGAAYESAKRKGTLVISTRPMTAEERVTLLLEALRRVFVEVPTIETETLKTLASVEDEAGERESASTVTFEPEQRAPQRLSKRPVELTDRSADERRARLDMVLRQVEAEVRS